LAVVAVPATVALGVADAVAATLALGAAEVTEAGGEVT
jgi:hypothetical protein